MSCDLEPIYLNHLSLDTRQDDDDDDDSDRDDNNSNDGKNDYNDDNDNNDNDVLRPPAPILESSHPGHAIW